MPRLPFYAPRRNEVRLLAGLILTAVVVINILIMNQGKAFDDIKPDYETSNHLIEGDGKYHLPGVKENKPAVIHQMLPVSRSVSVMTDPITVNKSSKHDTEEKRPTSHLFNLNSTNLTAVNVAILAINSEQFIMNRHKLDSDYFINENSVAIVIQVHNRPVYLRHLVRSLARTRGIENTLVIFSHDVYSLELNSITQSIDAFPVLQIFYPYSMQLYPNVFPGEHPNDCPRNIKKDEAIRRRCNNAAHPDKYGHYREANYTQTKHHWLWKVNVVFENLKVMEGFKGYVLLLEEDHYVSEDFLHVFNMLRLHRDNTCHDCNILTLGNYDKKPLFGPSSGKVELSLWISAKHNMGMAFNALTWQKMKACIPQFCKFDDYNWDWSLQYISMKCIPGRLKALALCSPRVFHIGECGVHHKGKVCLPDQKVAQLDNLLYINKNYLYPESLQTKGWARQQARLPKPNGGWGDIRDHKLCSSFVHDGKLR